MDLTDAGVTNSYDASPPPDISAAIPMPRTAAGRSWARNAGIELARSFVTDLGAANRVAMAGLGKRELATAHGQ